MALFCSAGRLHTWPGIRNVYTEFLSTYSHMTQQETGDKAIVWFDNMEEMATHTGIPKKMLMAAKKMMKADGCQAFRSNNKIFYPDFKDWWEEHQTEVLSQEDDNLHKHKTKKEKWLAKKAELEVLQLEGKFVLKSEVNSQMRNVINTAASIIMTKLRDELPAKTLGLDLVKSTVICEAFGRELISLLQTMEVK